MDVLYLASLYLRYFNRTLAFFSQEARIMDIWMWSLLRYRLVALPAGCSVVSNFISTIIAVDRCACVTWPLRAARGVSAKVTAVVIVVCGALILTGCLNLTIDSQLRMFLCDKASGRRGGRGRGGGGGGGGGVQKTKKLYND